MLESVNDAVVKVTHQNQAGWTGISLDWDGQRPYTSTTIPSQLGSPSLAGIDRRLALEKMIQAGSLALAGIDRRYLLRISGRRGFSPGEPVNVGDHQGVRLDHQFQKFQESAAVVLGPAGLLGPDVARGATGADQPLHLQVQILVLRLSDRDPGVTVQSHSIAPLAGIPEVSHSAKGAATGFSSHPLSYKLGHFQPVAGNSPVYSHGGRVRPGRSRRCRLGDHAAGTVVRERR